MDYHLKSPEMKDWLEPGACFTVTDMGGSTIDTVMCKLTIFEHSAEEPQS